MKIILNDLSYNRDIFTISDEYQIKHCINTFVEVLLLLQKNGIIKNKGDFESLEDIRTIDFGYTYNFQKWLNDKKNVKSEHQIFFKRFIDKYNIVIKPELISEFSCFILKKEYKSELLSKAIEQNSGVLSFTITKFFCCNYINGTYRFLDEKGNLKQENKKIINVYNKSNISHLNEICINTKYSNITSGIDLWEYREVLFPNLIICACVKEQIYDNPGMPHVNAIIKRLELLNNYYEKNDYFNINILGFKARDESETVKNNSNLNKLRKFKKPDNSYSYFYNHISFSGDFNGRIYFEANDTLKKIYIGYIGKHLPTAKY